MPRFNPFEAAKASGEVVGKAMSGETGLEKDDKEKLKKLTFRQVRWLLLFGIVVLVGVVVYAKRKTISGWFGGEDDSRLKSVGGAVSDRQCRVTESLCPKDSLCRNSNGSLSPPEAVSALGACCLEGCESPPIRACLPNERTCGRGEGCKFGTMPAPIAAMTPSGSACCTFECDSKSSLPVRDCFSSETLCPEDSKCVSFTGVATSPSARNSLGVCCRYNGTPSQCAAPA